MRMSFEELMAAIDREPRMVDKIRIAEDAGAQISFNSHEGSPVEMLVHYDEPEQCRCAFWNKIHNLTGPRKLVCARCGS